MDTAKLMALMKDKKAALKSKEKTIKPAPGANRYVLLPGWRKGDEHIWFHEFGQHFIKNEADEIQAIYVCTDKTFGRPCPVCESINRAMRMTADDSINEVLKKAVSGQTFLFNVLALDSKDDAVPQILEVRKTVFGQIVDLIEEWGAAVFDHESPQIITINREGKGLNTKYSVQISPKKHTLPKGVLDKLNNLDEYVRQESEEQQRRAISAVSSVAGLLPASVGGASADRPRTLSAPAAGSSDEDALREVETRNAAQVGKPAASEIALDDELDDLLGELNGTTGA